jgi:hypothetical protein
MGQQFGEDVPVLTVCFMVLITSQHQARGTAVWGGRTGPYFVPNSPELMGRGFREQICSTERHFSNKLQSKD